MGREIRRVPLGWKHPKDEKGYYIPLYDETYDEAWESLINEGALEPGDKINYRPAWPENAVMGYCVYEDTSEGTPISPIFENEDQVVEWLVKIGCDYRAAAAFVRDGWCSSFSHIADMTNPYINEKMAAWEKAQEAK